MSKVWPAIGRTVFWLTWPALLLYVRLQARARVLVVCQDRILLVKGWYSGGGWTLPGGGLHRHEAAVDGAARELHEETGIEVKSEILQHLGDGQFVQYGLRVTYNLFRLDLDEAQQIKPQAGEIVGAQWWALSELTAIKTTNEVRQALEWAGLHTP